MSRKGRPKNDLWEWENAMLTAYSDYRYRDVLQPLRDKFDEWDRGEASHGEMDSAIHGVHREMQVLYTMFGQKRSDLVRLVPTDREWFDRYLTEHPPPGEPCDDL